jgi:hypothetical protein
LSPELCFYIPYDPVYLFWPALTGSHPSKTELPAGKTPEAKPMDPSASVVPSGPAPGHRPNRPLNTPEACQYLLERHGIHRTTKTMNKYAVTGEGPRFRKAGRNRIYEPPHLDEYAESIKSPPVRSTSELPRREHAPRPPRAPEPRKKIAKHARGCRR